MKKHSDNPKFSMVIFIGLLYFAVVNLIYTVTNKLPPPTFWFCGILIAMGICMHIYSTKENK